MVVNDLSHDLKIPLKAEEVCQSIYRNGTSQEGNTPRPIIDVGLKGQIF